ncbi:Ribokinase-like protein [Gongronella butleri]|nr:Ribokinase-like protein [Gongronella butleri]
MDAPVPFFSTSCCFLFLLLLFFSCLMQPLLGSVGSLIIDDIRYADGTENKDVIGGAGMFAIYGMRLWFPGDDARKIGYVVHCGFDFPETIRKNLDSLKIGLKYVMHQDKHTTRGLNTFGDNDHRDFEYVHPIIRTTPDDFPDEWILSMSIVHIICATDRTDEIVKAWRRREKELNKKERSLFLWEPLPWACLPENYPNILAAGQHADIISPNDEEAASFLGLAQGADTTKELVEECVRRLARDFPHAAIVVRAGKKGAAVALDQGKVAWIPAYWTTPDRIVDVTGCGNAFCGGFMVGWLESKGDPVVAAAYGSVAASYVAEQVGVPSLNTNHGKLEQWNHGPAPRDRLAELLRRL